MAVNSDQNRRSPAEEQAFQEEMRKRYNQQRQEAADREDNKERERVAREKQAREEDAKKRQAQQEEDERHDQKRQEYAKSKGYANYNEYAKDSGRVGGNPFSEKGWKGKYNLHEKIKSGVGKIASGVRRKILPTREEHRKDMEESLEDLSLTAKVESAKTEAFLSKQKRKESQKAASPFARASRPMMPSSPQMGSGFAGMSQFGGQIRPQKPFQVRGSANKGLFSFGNAQGRAGLRPFAGTQQLQRTRMDRGQVYNPTLQQAQGLFRVRTVSGGLIRPGFTPSPQTKKIEDYPFKLKIKPRRV